MEACWLPRQTEIPPGAAWAGALSRARHAVAAFRPAGGTPADGASLEAVTCPSVPAALALRVKPGRQGPPGVRIVPGPVQAREGRWSPDGRRAVLLDLSSPTMPESSGAISAGAGMVLALWRGPQDNEPLRRLAAAACARGAWPLVPVVDLACAGAHAAYLADAAPAAIPFLYILADRIAAPEIWRALEPRSVVLALPIDRAGAPPPLALPELRGPPDLVLRVHAERRAVLADVAQAGGATVWGEDAGREAALLAARWAFHAGNFTLAGTLVARGAGGGSGC